MFASSYWRWTPSLVDQRLLGTGDDDSAFALDELVAIHPDLYNAYDQLFLYYQRCGTLYRARYHGQQNTARW